MILDFKGITTKDYFFYKNQNPLILRWLKKIISAFREIKLNEFVFFAKSKNKIFSFYILIKTFTT